MPLSLSTGDQAFDANAENASTGDYPLARFLYMYVNHRPGSQMEPLRREFIKLVFSKQGQEIVIKDGYFPVTAQIAKEDLGKIGVTMGR